MLKMSVKVGDSIQVGDDVILHIGFKRGRQVRVALETKASPINLVKGGSKTGIFNKDTDEGQDFDQES